VVLKPFATLVFCSSVAALAVGHGDLRAASQGDAFISPSHAVQRLTPSHYQQSPTPAAAAAAPASPNRAFVNQYCTTCHNSRTKAGGLLLDSANTEDVAVDAQIWEKVARRLRHGTMPPPGRPRPDQATYETVANRLEAALDEAAAKHPNPGRTNAVHRLNRAEYHNAIRDLLALEIDVTALLPGDDTSDSGFDNNADVLSISTSQLDRYMSTAGKISRLATGRPPAEGMEAYNVPLLLVQDDRQDEDLPFGSRGGAAIHHQFPVDGEYVIKVRLRENYMDYIMGLGTQHQLDVSVDDVLVKRFIVGGDAPGTPAPMSFTGTEFGDPEWEEYMRSADKNLDVRVPVKAGPHKINATFVRKMGEFEGIRQPRQRGRVLRADEVYMSNAALGLVEVHGPYNITGPGDTPSRREVFVCQPKPNASAAEESACATKILNRLARRAYRRPVTPAETQMLLTFFANGKRDGKSFDAGIQLAVERLLVDPNFLVRVYRVPAKTATGQAYRLGDFDLASRLSFFLWGSIPDNELLDLAEKGKLSDPGVREQQVRRMLADSRATQSLVDGFAAQWLHLRKVPDVLADPLLFPSYDDNLIQSFYKETEMFVASTLAEDRSVLDLLRADYTFVNERLATHYGFPGIYGSRFRRITVPDLNKRGGLLGHGGLLAMSSYANRTSPVVRGKWLLDTIVGDPPPSPPANVPPLKEEPFNGGKIVSVRERLEKHRANPVCASCHQTIDPLGFALENYDSLGQYRVTDEGGNVIDATGQMPSGAKVDGLSGVRSFLLSKPQQFTGTLTEKLFAYSLGRAVEPYDQPTIRKIVRDAAAQDYRWSSIVLGIVESPAFLSRNSDSE
jgi:mono/diheme cytochrome c family protein